MRTMTRSKPIEQKSTLKYSLFRKQTKIIRVYTHVKKFILTRIVHLRKIVCNVQLSANIIKLSIYPVSTLVSITIYLCRLCVVRVSLYFQPL